LVAPVTVILNVVRYCRVWRTPPSPVDPDGWPPSEAVLERLHQLTLPSNLRAGQPTPAEAVAQRLGPFRDEMSQRLLEGESLQQISEDIAERSGVSPEQVKVYYYISGE
jgi:hypothetical protein